LPASIVESTVIFMAFTGVVDVWAWAGADRPVISATIEVRSSTLISDLILSGCRSRHSNAL